MYKGNEQLGKRKIEELSLDHDGYKLWKLMKAFRPKIY